MTLDEVAIEATRQALADTGCRTPAELLRLLAEHLTDPADKALCRKPTAQWDVYDLRHWLRIITDYEDPDSPWGDEQ